MQMAAQPTMHRYLILVGQDNEMFTFEADTPAHAREQCLALLGLPEDTHFEKDPINEILFCAPVQNAHMEGEAYAISFDETWFHVGDMEIVVVPRYITNIDDIRHYLFPPEED